MLRVGLQFVIVACSVKTHLHFVICWVLDTLIMQFADILLKGHSIKHAIMVQILYFMSIHISLSKYELTTVNRNALVHTSSV